MVLIQVYFQFAIEYPSKINTKRHFTECALGLQYIYNIPFMYLNTVGFYTSSISRSGSPTPFSITPNFALAFTDNMTFIQRVANSVIHTFLQFAHAVSCFS